MSLRFLIVDDHRLFRVGLRSVLVGLFPDAVFEEAGSAAAALEAVQASKPDLVMMDLHLPDLDGIELSRQILALSPGVKVIMVSAEADPSLLNRALLAGISAYILKTCSREELSLAIRSALDHKLYLCPDANTVLLKDMLQMQTLPAPAAPALSERDLQVLRHTARGARMKEIAGCLGVGVKTVEACRRRLMAKLGCQSTADLVRYAIRNGIVEP